MRAHSFDWASNMRGHLHAVQAQIRSMQPKSIYWYVHCVNQSLDLALHKTASEIAIISNPLLLVKDCAKIFHESAKRTQSCSKKLMTYLLPAAMESDTVAFSPLY